jgi:RNA polymerase sigma factor (sigma-70 family)
MHPLTRSILDRLTAQFGDQLPDDTTLLGRFLRQRDALAFEVLVWRHAAVVWSACRRILRHQQDAEDAFQSVWIVLAKKAGGIGKRQSLGPWLHRVAVRAAMRARQRRSRLPLSAEVEQAVTPPAPDDLGELIDAEINRLPENHRRAFVLCQLEGLTLQQAAAVLGCPPATVGTWVARAKQRLRDRLPDPSPTLPVSVPLAIRAALTPETASPSVAFLVRGVLNAMMFEKVRAAAAILAAALLIAVTGFAITAGARSPTAAPPGEGLGGPLIGGMGGGVAEAKEEPMGSIQLAVIELEAEHYLSQFEQLLNEQGQLRSQMREARRTRAAEAIKQAEAEQKELTQEIEEVKKKLSSLEQERQKLGGPSRLPFRRHGGGIAGGV